MIAEYLDAAYNIALDASTSLRGGIKLCLLYLAGVNRSADRCVWCTVHADNFLTIARVKGRVL